MYERTIFISFSSWYWIDSQHTNSGPTYDGSSPEVSKGYIICGVGQAACSEDGLDIASNLGLEGDPVTDAPRKAWWAGVSSGSLVPVWRVSCDDGRLDPAPTETCQKRSGSQLLGLWLNYLPDCLQTIRTGPKACIKYHLSLSYMYYRIVLQAGWSWEVGQIFGRWREICRSRGTLFTSTSRAVAQATDGCRSKADVSKANWTAWLLPSYFPWRKVQVCEVLRICLKL